MLDKAKFSQAAWDKLVDQLFALDAEHPLLGQTIDYPAHVGARTMAEDWDEAKHPRDDRGRFGSGTGIENVSAHATTSRASSTTPESDKLLAHREPAVHVSDISKAIALVLQGRNVELDDVASVHTLLDKLSQMAQDAKAKGEQAPRYNLCQVSVANTNLFCAERVKTPDFPKGIPRISMPQLGGEPVAGSEAEKLPRNPWNKAEVDAGPAFQAYLRASGVGVSEEELPVATLRASQNELDGVKVAGLMKSPHLDLVGNPLFVSRDNYVIDGHHRWAAAIGKEAATGRLGDLKTRVVKIDMPISEVLHVANIWTREFGIKPAAGPTGQTAVPFAEFDPDKHPRSHGGQFAPVPAPAHIARIGKIDTAQAHIEAATKTLANSPTPFYHGTASDAWSHIQKDGLVPHAGKGGDTWAAERGFGVAQYDVGERHNSVYMSRDMQNAKMFAAVAAQETHSIPVLLRVDVPKDQVWRIKEDEKFENERTGHNPAVRVVGKIPPSWISLVAYGKSAADPKLVNASKAFGFADAAQAVFVVFLVDGGVK